MRTRVVAYNVVPGRPELKILLPVLHEELGPPMLEVLARYRLCALDLECPCGARPELDREEFDFQHVGLRHRYNHADECPLNPSILDPLIREQMIDF